MMARPSAAPDLCADGAHPVRAIPGRRPDAAAVERAAGMLRAAGDRARLTLLTLLADGESCVSELSAWTNEPVANVSQRVRLMKQEGLLASRRSGKHVFYSLADQHVADLMLAVLAHAQEGHADRTPPDADP